MAGNINRLIFPVLTALAAVPVGAYAGGPVASANAQLAAVIAVDSHQLNDAQMDMVTAGQLLGAECPGCTLASSMSTSTNGTTTSMSSTGVTPGGGGSSSGGGGAGGASGAAGADGGSGSGSGGGTGAGGGGPSIPNLSTSTPQVPAKVTAIITAASTPTILNP